MSSVVNSYVVDISDLEYFLRYIKLKFTLIDITIPNSFINSYDVIVINVMKNDRNDYRLMANVYNKHRLIPDYINFKSLIRNNKINEIIG